MGGQEPVKTEKYFSTGLLAHVDAGKTTLSEALLYLTGAIRKMGRVDDRDAFLDTYELERERGITIFSKQAIFDLGQPCVFVKQLPGPILCALPSPGRDPLSRSYRVSLPSSLTVNHSSALEYSSRLRVSVYGTGTYRI